LNAQTSRISSEIDFERDGKQTGFLRLPHSVHRSAYGWLAIPVVCIANGPGPKVLLISGNHGDEYEGQVTLMKLARELEPDGISGRVIIVSAANAPAARVGRRTSPLDFAGEGNLNRAFPGDANGSPTEMIAHYIVSELLPRADFVFDLHSGGHSLRYIPSAEAKLGDDGEVNARQSALLKAFGLPISNVGETFDDRTLAGTAKRLGITFIGTELGGGGTVSAPILSMAEQGLRRCLKHIGTLPQGDAVDPPPATRLVYVGGADYFVYAPDDGLFEPYVELGQMVEGGQAAGAVHFPETPWQSPVIAHFQRAGLVLCERVGGRVERGDCLFHLATDHKE
jgi:hypothetical protein